MTAITRPPGPNGGIWGVNNLRRFQQDTLGFLTDVGHEFKDIAYFRMAAFEFYQINNPTLVHQTVVKQGKRIQKWDRQTNTWIEALNGPTSLTMEGERWKRNRRILMPSFRAKSIARYYDVIIKHTDRLVKRWEPGKQEEMMFEMMRTTMGIIADIIFTLDDIEKDAADLNWALTTVFEVLTKRTIAFQPPPAWLPIHDNRRMNKAKKTVEAFIMPLIKERRKNGSPQQDILADLVDAVDEETGEKLTDEEICNELKTLFGAGHETTALMLMWTLYLLTQHPEVDQKLFEEADRVLGGRIPTQEDLDQMPYTEQVINESMRFFPPAWSMMVREVLEPLEVGGYTIPKGSILLIPMWVIHRSPEIYEKPLEFNPDRFSGDWKKNIPKFAFFPFGGGPHICIGAHLSIFEGRLMLPMLVQKFRYELPPQPLPDLQALLTLRPKNGLFIRPETR